ncbi:hypothetical protein LYSHEL_16010 [Lysobacter helvus]|uniref:Uncharacterized protein n=2 Tax=Lysobacteraceae TaxID=32033 RepID=A0ABN6FSB7_9GAMM|nr:MULTISPECIES: hypothetical protein [Lysobacter]BCT92577.1 hypothetical protein LYSCAS_16010 [Lysobacter caseinilyticus]BCT95730.1 hypothetical protein LYSHEL_16010 [Lysobacter helvus]
MFKVNNLIVSLIPGAKLDINECGNCSPDTHCNGCTNQYSDCPGGCSNQRSDFSEHCPPQFEDPAELVKLEALLEQALVRVRARHRERATLRPRSLQESDALIERLQATLKEVDALKPVQADKPEVTVIPPAGMFRVRDLLISVLKPFDTAADSGCPGCTCVAGCSGATGCTNASTREDFDPMEERERFELQALLGHVTIATGVNGAARAPTTSAEITALRAALQDAIARLERVRALSGEQKR